MMCIKPIREWRQFSNSARQDGLLLSHWCKASEDPEGSVICIDLYFVDRLDF